MVWAAIGTGKQPQGLTQWPFKEGKLASFQCGGVITNTWHQSPLLHRTASFLLTQCPLLWILEVSSEVSLRLVFVLLLLVSSVLEVCSSINKVFHEVSLSFGFSLLGSSFNKITSFICNAESSFLITNSHILLFQGVCHKGGVVWTGFRKQNEYNGTQWSRVDGTKLFAYAAKTQLMRVVDHWWTIGGAPCLTKQE